MSIVKDLHIALEVWGCFFSLIAAFCVYLSRDITHDGNRIMIYMQLSNACLLFFDALAWSFRGDVSSVGYYMVRISNFFVFVFSYVILCLFTYYLMCWIQTKGLLTKTYKWMMQVVIVLCLLGVVLVIVSQFNGMYDFFDENNFYCRNDLFWISQTLGIAGTLLNFIVFICCRRGFSRREFLVFLSYFILPIIALVVQLYVYGIALLNISITIALLLMFLVSQADQAVQLVEQTEKVNEMQIQVILSQIQPHFLYNVLNSIYHLCEKDSKAAQDAISNFSDYLRSNMDSLRCNVPIPFENELRHVKNYISLEKMRFNDELNIVYDIGTTNFMLPALSVQPLVENAVKHGVRKKKHGGTVKIPTVERETFYEITVLDDGVGYHPDAIEKADRSHTGIENVSQRLWTMCGATLEIKGIPGEGTKAIIRLPKKK